MNIKNLRKSILQYAVEGKLVQQDINDEPASILYDKIIKEKETLVNMRKIKKEKPLPPITDEEIPYSIPENWKWVRLGDIISIIQGTSYNKSDITSNKQGIRIIRGGNIKNYNINILNDDIYIKQANFNIEKQIYKNDIIIVASTGSKTILGNASFAYTDYVNTQIGAFLRIIRPYNLLFFPYLRIIFMTNYYMEYIKIHSKGIGINNIKNDTINSLPIPLPPLKEQERIVKKVDELMALCDKLEQEEEKILALDKHFADTLPKSILQYAVEGKLVQQNIHDEPASILYDKIIKEKETLVNMRKIKKEKPLPPITDDEMPYNIPENWKWVRLGEVCSLLNGEKITNTKLPLLNAKYLRTRQEKQIYTEGIKVNKNDYIILVDGENSGEVFKAFEDGILGSTFKILNINLNLYNNYILYILCFYKDTFKKSKKGAAIPHLDKVLFKNLIIPLPPLKEQERIVTKVDELLTYCNKLKDII